MIIVYVMIVTVETDPRRLVRLNPQLDLGRIKALVLRSVTSIHTRRAYDQALHDFLVWCRTASGVEEFNKAAVQRYARQLEKLGLSASTINVRLTAVRRLAAKATDRGLLAPGLAAGISRVKGSRVLGTRTGNSLTVDQAERLINTPDPRQLKGKRDRALLAVLIGCGLRRSEVSDLTFGQIQQRDGRWAIVGLRGQGNRIRTTPMADHRIRPSCRLRAAPARIAGTSPSENSVR